MHAPKMSSAFAAGLIAAMASGGVAQAQPKELTVTIANVSTDQTLKLADGTATKAPIAPGAYAVISAGMPIFSTSQPAGTDGLEALAEDGNAEPLVAKLQNEKNVRQAGLFIPGQPFAVQAEPADRLVFATMFVQSNDLFYGPEPAGIPLFNDAGQPTSGNVTKEVMLWDAGTEKNEAPGIGPNQAPRQSKPNSGPAENGPVQAVADGNTYPAVKDVVEVTISAK